MAKCSKGCNCDRKGKAKGKAAVKPSKTMKLKGSYRPAGRKRGR